MKKIFSLFLIIVITLSFYACSSNGSEEKLIGEIDLGVTKNQVIEQLGYSDDYYEEYKGDLTYRDIKIFDQYCKSARFMFENNELTSVTIIYPSGADSNAIIKTLEKAYGEIEDYSTDKNYYWTHGNATISLLFGEDSLGLAIFKSED